MVTVIMMLTGVVFLLMSCGGGGDEPTQLSSVPGFSAGTLTRGSVIVNGTTFTAAAGSTVRIDDNPGTEGELRDGMQAKVKGTISADGTSGQFEALEVEAEVHGTLTGKGVDDFLVNGQRVVVDDLTKIENRDAAGNFTAIGFNDLADLNEVEVHGGRDDLGRIRATGVERHAEDGLDEVKGFVAAPITATTFALVNGTFSITVDFSGATFSPLGKTAADLSAGVLVEAHGDVNAFDIATGTFTATRIDFEDDEDAQFGPAEGIHMEVEGLISGFTAHPGAFAVGGFTVQTGSATRFVNGDDIDLGNNIKVEAEGRKSGNILVADKIKFKDSLRIEANVTDLAGDGSSVTALGKTVKITTLTEINNGPITVGSGIRIRGFAAGSTVTAIRIDVTNPVSNELIRGPVTAATPATSLDIAGLTVNTAGAIFRDTNDAAISANAFFGAIKTTPPATVVKAKGSFAAGTLTASEVEMEDPL